jgi:hypothetical protein
VVRGKWLRVTSQRRGREYCVPVLTADRRWEALDLDVEARLIR